MVVKLFGGREIIEGRFPFEKVFEDWIFLMTVSSIGAITILTIDAKIGSLCKSRSPEQSFLIGT